MKGLLLLVEDNSQIMYANERMLTHHGYLVATAATLEEARGCFQQRLPDAVVLDLMLPDGNGLDFVEEIRVFSQVPILLLTGLTSSATIVQGLSCGADDYLAKPYDFDVLLARIEALLRRSTQTTETLVEGALWFDVLGNRVFLNNAELMLTPKEFWVLYLLVKNKGEALSAEYLYKAVWKQPLVLGDSSVKNVISRLRKKLGVGFAILYDMAEEGYILETKGDT